MELFKRLRQIVEINSFSHNKHGVDSVGRVISQWMESLGFDKKVFDRQHLGDHLLFTTKSVKDIPKILFLGHTDTVFAPGKFEGFREDNTWVYGPGVCDMKGGIVVAIEGLKSAFEERHDLFNIDFLLVSDEEIGSDDSRTLLSSLSSNYDFCIDFEAAGENMEIVTARKGIGTYTIHIEGKAAHAGVHFSKGVSANLEAAHKSLALNGLVDLNNETIVNVGKISGGIGANTVSPHANILFEFRYDKIAEKERVLKAAREISNTSYIPGTTSTIDGCIQREVMTESTAQLAFVQQLRELTGDALPTESRSGVSDANIVASAGTITLDGFGPYGDGDHTSDERALKESFHSRIELMRKIICCHQEGKILTVKKVDVLNN